MCPDEICPHKMLIEYFMEETNKKIDALQRDLGNISTKLEDLQTFKASMIESSKWTSVIVSGVMGLLGFAVHIGLDYLKR